MAQSSSNTSSRRHAREHDTVSIGSSRVVDAEWEANEVITIIRKTHLINQKLVVFVQFFIA